MRNHLALFTAYKMGLVIWDDTLQSYMIDGRDVTREMELLTFIAKAFDDRWYGTAYTLGQRSTVINLTNVV